MHVHIPTENADVESAILWFTVMPLFVPNFTVIITAAIAVAHAIHVMMYFSFSFTFPLLSSFVLLLLWYEYISLSYFCQ